MVPYGVRKLRFTFELGEGRSFGWDGINRLTVEGLRAEIQLTLPVTSKIGGPGTAVMAIYGLTIDVMNQLAITGRQFDGRRNRVKVEASTTGEDDEDPWVLIYVGQIWQAYPVMNQQPEPAMLFFSAPGDAAAYQLKPVDPVSIEGSAKASTLIERAAAQVGYEVDNHGVDAQLSNPYLKGSALDQITTVLDAVDAYGTISRTDNRVSIWPRDGDRGNQVAELSPASGLIGYPEFEQKMIRVHHLFDPAVVPDPGMRFKVQSPLTSANGIWIATQITLNLSCEMPGGGRGVPGGPWEMLIQGIPGD